MPIHQFKRIEIGFLIFFNGIENICKIKPKVAFSSVKFPLHHTADSCLKGNFVEGHINWGANMWIKLEFIFVHIIFDRQGLPDRFIFFSLSKRLVRFIHIANATTFFKAAMAQISYFSSYSLQLWHWRQNYKVFLNSWCSKKILIGTK